jgi:hypothetical protein
MPDAVAADVLVPGVATLDAVAPEASATATPDAVAPEAPAAATPDTVPPEAPTMTAVAPTPGLATASTAAAGAAMASISVPEVPTSVPDVPTPSSEPAVEEELEVVSGRRLLQGPPEEDAVPLPQVLVRVRQTIEEATSTAEAAFQREWTALESERQHLGDWHIRLEERTKDKASRAAAARSELEADQESFRKGLWKVFNQEFAVSR